MFEFICDSKDSIIGSYHAIFGDRYVEVKCSIQQQPLYRVGQVNDLHNYWGFMSR